MTENNELQQENYQALLERFVPIYLPNRTNYILSLLTEKEVYNGIPTTDGLRRIAQYFFGPLNYSTILHHFSEEGAAIIVRVQGYLHYGNYWKEHDPVHLQRIIEVTGASDCLYRNVMPPYNKHLVAVAETKAEGRALKKMLGMQVATFEEMEINQQENTDNKQNDFVLDLDKDDSSKLITNTQKQFIELMAQKLQLPVNVILQHAGYNKALNDVTYQEAMKLTEIITELTKSPKVLEKLKNQQ
jgi:hypothetical protein